MSGAPGGAMEGWGSTGRGAWPWGGWEVLPARMPGGREWPRISVVTPSLNQGAFIEETLRSVRGQGYPNVEHIVIDGGSTDATMEIVGRYRDGLAHVVSEPDGGQSAAINKGMRLATGGLLTWLNADDMLAPGALAAAAVAWVRTGCDLVVGECHVREGARVVRRHLSSVGERLVERELLDLERGWLAGRFFYQPEVVFTRGAWERAGGMVDERWHYSMDYELWARMARLDEGRGARVTVIGRPLALFRAHAGQKTASSAGGGFRAELPKVRERVLAGGGAGRVVEPLREPTRRVMRAGLVNDLGFSFGAGIAHGRIGAALAMLGHRVGAVCAAEVDEWWNAPGTTHADVLAAVERMGSDLVVVGNLHGVDLHPSLVHRLAERGPVAVVMHDLWWLTGRCAYPGGCDQWRRGCSETCACAGAYPRAEPQERAGLWRAKREVLGHPNVHVWANSRWTAGLAREAVGHERVAAIRLGVDTSVFVPRDRAMCREELGLPQDAFIVMTSATTTDDVRKGGGQLVEAMNRLAIGEALVVAAGEQRPHSTLAGLRCPVRYTGYVREAKRLAMLLSAADVFVGPSSEEAFGQVFVEAAACGTPSVGHDVGGVGEAIADGISGVLTKVSTAAGLAAAIGELAFDVERRQAMGRTARLFAEGFGSLSASAWSIHRAMEATGLAERLGLSHAMTIEGKGEVDGPRLVRPTWPGWRAVEGIEGWDGPYAEHDLPRFRWFLPRAVFEMFAEAAGPGKLVLCGRILGTEQRVRLLHGEGNLTEREISQGGASLRVEHTLAFDVHVRAGWNRFTLESWAFDRGARPLALAVTAAALFAV